MHQFNKQLIFNSRAELDTKESKMKIELNSSICPLVDFTTYEGLLSFFYLEEVSRDGLGDFENVTVSQGDVDACIMEKVCDYMQDDIAPTLAEYGVKSFSVGEICKPKEYNFYHDSFDFTAEMDEDWKARAIAFLDKNSDNEELHRYISDNWKSCDGFLSFMPESMEVLKDGLRGLETSYSDVYLLGAYLTLAGIVSEAKVPFYVFEEDVYDYILSNTNITASYYYIPEDWLEIYNKDSLMDELYYSLSDVIGCPWRGFNTIRDEISSEDFECVDNASRLISWAIKNDLGVEDVQDIIAGRKVYEYGLLMYA